MESTSYSHFKAGSHFLDELSMKRSLEMHGFLWLAFTHDSSGFCHLEQLSPNSGVFPLSEKYKYYLNIYCISEINEEMKVATLTWLP